LHDFKSADLVIANLECPLIKSASPIRKTGPTFGESTDCIKAIQAAEIDLLCLANNHIMDHGPRGLASTLAACHSSGIATVGAGENLARARQLFIRRIGNVRVAVLAVAEREFSIASADCPGANPLDVIDFVRNIKENRHLFDFLIVLFHGGDEFHVPSPRVKDTCHFFVEMGANAVVVQHPHVVGGVESYHGGHIVYGQGALIMDEAIYRNHSGFHEGFLVRLIIAPDHTSTMEIIPFEQSKSRPGARRLGSNREREFLRALKTRSDQIKDDNFVASEWLAFCERLRNAYLSDVLGHNRLLRKLNKYGLVERLCYSRRALRGVRNTISCETHNEALRTIFDQLM
jgi:poly-gamma-glutamate synthesis protein (capsule biosynthesis protein)